MELIVVGCACCDLEACDVGDVNRHAAFLAEYVEKISFICSV
jgi:hypothetical protein